MSLSKYPLPGEKFVAASKIRTRLYTDVHTSLKSKYDSYGSSNQQPNSPFSVDDVGYIIEELFRGRSAMYPFHTSRLTLAPWRPEGGVAWGNLVCLTKAEAIEHEKRVLSGREKVEDVYDPEVVSRIEEIWKEEREMRKLRWGNMYSTKA